MPYNNKFEEFFGTLFHSWGGDTPQETVWAANDLIEALSEMFGIVIVDRFDLNGITVNGNDYDDLEKEIYNKLKERL